MKLILGKILGCLIFLGCFVDTNAQCSYTYSKTITIDHNQVSGSADLVDFPVYITFTSPQLATTSNGGNIQNANGYDVRLMLNDCRCWLDFIIHSYNAVTGTYEIYVTVPALKASENTSLEIFYGNSSISTNPSTDTTYNSTRTADWIATTNANRSSPSTFYTIGAQKNGDCTGPGGVGQMDGTSELQLWFKPDCGVEDQNNRTVLNGGDVYIWRDQSGNARNAVEATNRPVYQTNQVQGEPAIRFFAANDDRLLADGVPHSNQFMIFIVASITSLASNNIGLIHAAPNGNAFSTSTASKSIGMWVSNAGLFWGRLIQSNGTTVNYNQAATAQTGTYYIMSNYADGTNTGQYIQGLSSASTGYNNTIQQWEEFGIGRQANESWDGHIAEVIVYNRTLNESERGEVENYLSQKYGASIPRLSGSTGPGGIGESDGSSSLELWYDASDLDGDGTTEGAGEGGQASGTVSTWVDKSGKGRNLAAGSATYTTSNAGLNSKPSVDFNGTNQYLQSGNVDLTGTGSLEYFLVFDDAVGLNGANNNAALFNWETTGNQGGVTLEGSGTNGQSRNRYSEGGAYTNVNVAGFNTGNPYIYNVRYGSSGRLFLRNGTSISTNATAISINSPATAPFTIGRNISTGGNYFAVDVAEFISFSLELNLAEKEIVQQYLSEKYSITLSGTDYYTGHSGTYNLGVQGIGSTDGSLTNSHVVSDASDGLIITMANGSFNATNEYIFTGHNDPTDGLSTDDLGSLPAVVQRIRRVWYLDKTGAVDVTLTFDIHQSTGSGTFPIGNGYVLLYSPSAGPYVFQDWTATYGITPVVGDKYISFTVPNSPLADGYYTVATTDATSNPLPVELTWFEAKACGSRVCLEWETAAEINNDFFGIERSGNGQEWETLSTLKGAGTTDRSSDYAYVDQSPLIGESYYRLKQTDFDGSFDYSPVRRVSFDLRSSFDIFPNPAKDSFAVRGENVDQYTFHLFSLDGKPVWVQYRLESPYELVVDTRHLQSGIYILSLEYQGTAFIRTIIRSDR